MRVNQLMNDGLALLFRRRLLPPLAVNPDECRSPTEGATESCASLVIDAIVWDIFGVIAHEDGPYQGGGEMIKKVTFEKSTYNELPYKFEAGTPNIAGAIGLGAAIDYLTNIGVEEIDNYETELLNYATEKLLQIEGLSIIGNAKEKASVISIIIDNIHPTDLGTMADAYGIAMRVGHHCTQPVMDFFGIPGTCRASFSFYNTKEEVDFLVNSILKIKKMLG